MKNQKDITKSIKEIEKINDEYKKYSKYYVNNVPSVTEHTDLREGLSVNKKLEKTISKFLRLIRFK